MNEPLLKVLITASGVGVPLGELTKYTNKTLIKIGKKPTLSYIIDQYPRKTEFVITLGHYSQHVRDFTKLVYPKLNVKFVEVDKYEGPGSSLIYSMLKASKHLQSPFIYHASDTIVLDGPSKIQKNWIAGFKGSGSSNYASFDVVDGNVQTIYEKGMPNPDYLHIGLVGIKDYKVFWQRARKLYKDKPNNQSLSDIDIIRKLLEDKTIFTSEFVSKWFDVGNIEGLNRARCEIEDSFHILDKPTESIYFLNDKVVKFFHNQATVNERVARAKILKGIVPSLSGVLGNFYSYNREEGELMSEIVQPKSLRELLTWAEKKLWLPINETKQQNFKNICLNFYQNKTQERLKDFCSTRKIDDVLTNINGEKIPSAKDLLAKVNFNSLTSSEQTHFHGDFVLDNILKTKSGFCLLDWRQNFGGLLKAGDKYYDLAKLNHNLTVNHGIVNNNMFSVQISKKMIKCEIMRKHSLVQCTDELFRYLEENKYDTQKVKVLTAIIWLNMAPLHEHPFDLFLYYFGRLNLWYALRNARQ